MLSNVMIYNFVLIQFALFGISSYIYMIYDNHINISNHKETSI